MNTETRPGIRTSEFWLLIISNLLINVGAIDVGSAKIRGIFAIASLVGYTISRGLAKAGVANDVPAVVPDEGEPGDADAVPHIAATPSKAVPPDEGDIGHG